VDKSARIGAEVEIGPYCVVGPETVLADGCKLVAHVHIAGRTSLGPRTTVYPFSSLGTPPQSVHYKGEASALVIGADCVIRENVTMNIGTTGGRMETRIGDRCMFMAGSHVAHDCIIGNEVTFANYVMLGGHCAVGDFTFFGGKAAAHQNVRIGEQVMVGGAAGCVSDVIPYSVVVGDRARLSGINVVGLRRRGVSADAIRSLWRAYRMLFFGEGLLAERLEMVAKNFAGDAHVERIVAFVREGGKRPIATPRARTMSADGEED
jgi:UDP-N-acetylglucosamine acyltransferase